MAIELQPAHVAIPTSTTKSASGLIPSVVLDLLGDPPLIHGEERSDYYQLFG